MQAVRTISAQLNTGMYGKGKYKYLELTPFLNCSYCLSFPAAVVL